MNEQHGGRWSGLYQSFKTATLFCTANVLRALAILFLMMGQGEIRAGRYLRRIADKIEGRE